MPRLYLRLSLAAIVVGLLTISTGAALAAPSQQTSGICGRTAAVQTAILGEISGATDCALVTDAHLAAITGALDLEFKNITALAAGDLDGLTALTTLYLHNNSLTTLPAGVFDELTALEYLQLQDNPGAPFSPTADALPDDGTVPAAGGTVALDGSSSDGGPWDANVDYSWSQTSGPTSGVTFDAAAGATPVVTIPALTAGTELIFTLTVTGRATATSSGTAPGTDTAKVTVTASNSAPTFDEGADTTRAVPENSAAGTDVGAAVSATDGEGDTLTYSLGGMDAGSFDLDTTTGQIRTKANVAYNYEVKSSYTVTVSVHDGKDAAGDTDTTIDATIDVTINLTNVAVGGRPEPVANVAAVPGDSPGEIVVTWDPHPDGHEDYRVAFKPVDGRFQPVSDTAWNVFPLDNTATLAGLVPGAEYRILVRARFADGTISKWARPVSGLAAEEAPPEFEEVWSSVLTVGSLPAGVLGFQSYQGPSFAQGSLSPDEFLVDGEPVRVIALFNYTGLVLGLSEELPRDFVLLSGSQEFAARDSFVQSMGTARGRYWWPTAPVGWAEGDEVELSIAISDSGSMPQRPPAPPSGVFDDTPTSHDGVSPFEVRLVFDESNLSIDSQTLKDHALAAAGADIAAVRKYSRASQNSWIVTLQPTGPGAITLTLPATTDCAQPDAVCATDGRKLRARIETTIPGSADASLSTLDTVGAVIDPAFDPAEMLYTADAAPGVSQLTVAAEAAAAAHGATVSITPADTDAATAGHQVDLTAGADTALHITVTAPDATTTQSYWVVISDTSTPADTASALNSMQFTGLETLTFDDHQNRYELTAPADVSHTTVVTSRADTGATVETITVRAGSRTLHADHHDADTSEPGHQVQLAGTGDTLVIVRVTTNDGLNQSVYLTLITRTTDTGAAPKAVRAASPKDTADSALPELSSLTLTGADLSPVFAPDTFEYRADAAAAVEEITIDAEAADTDASVLTVPADADPNTDGWQITLGAPGSETVIAVIVNSNGQLSSYLVTVSREAVQTATTLQSLSIDDHELTPVFDAATHLYAAEAPAEVSEVTIRAVATDPGATVQAVPADADPNQPGHQLNLGAPGTQSTTSVAFAPAHNTYVVIVTRAAPDPADASLRSLAVDGYNLTPAFASDTYPYRVDVPAHVDSVTVDAIASSLAATVTVTPTEADPLQPGHQVNLAEDSTVIVTVESSDGTQQQTYTVVVTVARPVDFDRSPRRDLDVVDAVDRQWHLYPYGLWSDGDTMWVAANWDAKIYAYDLASGDRRAASDIDSLDAAGNSCPGGIWSDGDTMWVLDEIDDKIYAYDLASGDRRAASDIDTLVPYYNQWHMDLWSDGTKVWVADSFTSWVFAYDLASGARRTASDIGTLNAAGNSNPGGIWSDGNTMWVLDETDDKIYAYDLASGARQAKFDFNTLSGAGNNSPSSIWSDGDTMWVLDSYDRKVYAYNMPASLPLKSLELTGVEFAFTPERHFYAVEAPAAVAATTVSAVAADDSADVTVTILPADADINTAGHQIDLATGVNTVTVTVTAAGTATVTAYTVVVTRNHVDVSGDSTTAGVLDLGVRVDNINRSASVRGVVDDDDDRDWYKVELQSKHRYYIDMKQTGTPDSLGDPMIMGVHDSNGDLVAGTTNDWGGDTRWRDLGEYLVEEIEWSEEVDYLGWPFWIPPEFGPNDVGGRDAFVKFSPRQTGTYFVSVGRGAAHSSNYQNGVYDLEIVERLHEIGDTPATSQRVVVGEPAVSEIDIDPREVFFATGDSTWEWWSGDHDWWRATLERNRIYVIDMQGADTGHGTLRQPHLAVRPRDGGRTPINTVRIMEDVDGTENDRQVFSPTATGDYYMLAMGGDYESISAPEELGTYTLSVTVLPERADVPAATTTTASVVVDASPYYGRIDHSYDRDWIGVQLQGGRSYRVTMGTDPASIAPISDDPREIPYEVEGVFMGTRVIGGRYRDVAGVFDGAGNLVRGSGEFGNHGGVPNYPDEIIIEPEEDDIYYIEARGFDFHVGDYTITVEESFGPPIDIWTPGLQSNPYFGYLEALGSTTIEVDTLTEGYAYTDSSIYPLDGQVPTWFSVELVAGDTYIVNVESVGGVTSGYPFNAYIRGIFDDSGRYEYFHRGDHGAATRSQLAVTARSSGLYHIAVERRPSGNFTIIVNSTSTDSTTTQTPPPQDDASLSSLGVAGDDVTPEFASGVYDYSVTVAPDVSEATVDAVGTYPETVVVASVEDLDLAPGWQVDLGPPGTETVTEIRFTSVAPDGRRWLAYTVTITRPAPDVSAGTSTDSDVEIGVGVASRIHSVGDRDWHRVELQAGVTYQVDMEGQWTGSFSTSEPGVWISDYTLVDPVLSGVYDSLGALVPGTGDLTDSGNSGTGQNSRFTFSPTVDGTYYIEAAATAAWVGTYLLTVSRIPD